MHTLYIVYDENNKVTGFVIDNVSMTQNYISFDRGPLSYIRSIIDNLNGYIKKNGNLTVENGYLNQVRHGKFDETYGEIQDKRTDNLNYTFNTQTSSQPTQPAQQPAKPQQPQQSTLTSQPSEPTTPTTSTPQTKPSEPVSAPDPQPAQSTPSK